MLAVAHGAVETGVRLPNELTCSARRCSISTRSARRSRRDFDVQRSRSGATPAS